MDNKIDYSKLPKDLQDKMLKWEQNKPEFKQVKLLEEIQSMFEELILELSKAQNAGEATSKQSGAVLLDIREAIRSLAAVEAPESPDVAKPIVDALSKLEKALTASVKSISVTPTFKPSINVDSPTVNVDAPKVDLSGVEKVLRSDIPKAFEKAIALIPKTEVAQTDLTPLEELLSQMSEQLQSIDTATRMKPQAPNTIKVVNPDGSNVGGATVYSVNDIEDGTTSYFGKTTSDGTWQVAKVTDTSVSYATVTNNGAVTSYTDAWTNRATLTYGRYDEAF